MASYTLHFGKFKPNSAGIMEICKSGGMQACLSETAKKLEGAANTAGHLHRTSRRPIYASGVDVHAVTAVGWVGTGNNLSRIDEAYHHTLESLSH